MQACACRSVHAVPIKTLVRRVCIAAITTYHAHTIRSVAVDGRVGSWQCPADLQDLCIDVVRVSFYFLHVHHLLQG